MISGKTIMVIMWWKFVFQIIILNSFNLINPQNEPFSAVKERVQKKLDIPDKEFEKVGSLSSHIDERNDHIFYIFHWHWYIIVIRFCSSVWALKCKE